MLVQGWELQVELRYQVPVDRLVKLGRSAGRKAYRSVWVLFWVVLAAGSTMFFASVFYRDALDVWMEEAGFPLAARIAIVWVPFAVFLAGLILLRRLQRHQARSRLDFDLTTRLSKDEDGLRFATDGIEYYVKWRGISQMLMEHDGIVVSCGNLFFLVPDTAFPDAGARLAFIRDVYGHLTEKARSISEKYIRPVLNLA